MRLIDADKIRFTDLSDGRGLCYVAFVENIEKMPTIEAIPIEWIEKWLEQFDGEENPRIYVEEFLLDDWRKEND